MSVTIDIYRRLYLVEATLKVVITSIISLRVSARHVNVTHAQTMYTLNVNYHHSVLTMSTFFNYLNPVFFLNNKATPPYHLGF